MISQRFWMFGPDEWASLFGVRLSAAEKERVGDFPDATHLRILESECRILRGLRVRDTSFAFLGLDRIDGEPLTIAKLHEMLPESTQPHLYMYEPPTHEFGHPVHVESPWYIRRRYSFAVEHTCEFRWYIAPLPPLLTNRYTSISDQLRAIPPGYEWADAVVELLKRVLFFKLTGIRVRHVAHVAGPGPVSPDVWIGGVSEDGIQIGDGYQHGALGLSRIISNEAI